MTGDPKAPSAEALRSPTMQHRPCPRCQVLLPVHPGYPTWCDQCGWNLEVPPAPPSQGLFEKLDQAIGIKFSQRLFEQMRAGRSLTASVTPAKVLALLIAGGVHSVTAAFLLLGLWFAVIALPTMRLVGILLSLPCFGMAWLLLPRFPHISARPLPRDRVPALYRLTERIASAMGSPRVDGILYDLDFNAAFGQYGWRRRRFLILGLPLLAVLSGQELVALIGHELAHGVNGDVSRGLFLGAAMHSLATWYDIVHPRNRWHISAGMGSVLLLVINVVSLGIAGVIWLVAYALDQLLWHDRQRGEYLADWLAAQTGGTQAQLSAL